MTCFILTGELIWYWSLLKPWPHSFNERLVVSWCSWSTLMSMGLSGWTPRVWFEFVCLINWTQLDSTFLLAHHHPNVLHLTKPIERCLAYSPVIIWHLNVDVLHSKNLMFLSRTAGCLPCGPCSYILVHINVPKMLNSSNGVLDRVITN